MSRPQSRVRRKAAFMQEAEKMYEELEEWYDKHPEASFGEIEAEARKQRRKLMGKMLGDFVNGRDVGVQIEAQKCEACGAKMEFEGYCGWNIHGLEGDSRLERAYYVCPHCKGQTLFPLDQKLKLRPDHWSEGAARVATRHGLQSKSFDKAAELYSDSTGGNMSGDSLRRITEGFGQRLEEKREKEAQQVYAEQRPEAAQAIVTVTHPIKEQASISTDGGMVLLRSEGWKEFKMSVISEVRVKAGKPSATEPHPDPQVSLHRHSYQVGLWTADQIGQHQYLEGTRRQVEGCAQLGSPNDGAVWINRITTTNYPQIVYSIDWAHASGRLSSVGKAAFGDGTTQAQQWAHETIDRLWHGQVAEVVTALQTLDWEHISCLDDIRNSPAYFENRQSNMEYARLRQMGFPIGSGAVEGGINTVVHHRMKRQGRGWKRNHAQSMMAALGELHSDRFLLAWQASY